MSYYISSLTACFTEEYTLQSLVAYQRAHTAVSGCLPKSTSRRITPCLPKSTSHRVTPCLPKSTSSCHSLLTKEYIIQRVHPAEPLLAYQRVHPLVTPCLPKSTSSCHSLLTKEYILLSLLAYQKVVLKGRSFSISLLEVLLPLNSSLKMLLFRQELNCHSFPKRGRRGEEGCQ